MSENRVSTYPLPPMQYISCYTDERVLSGNAPPPPPPLDSNYVMFGVPCTKEDAVIHSLESQGLRRLYPPLYDHKLELKTLNFSILANFLDLIDILIKCPDSPERAQKLEHIKTLFINMHHLINEYRPLQARDTLIEMLIHQGSVTRQTVDTAAKYLAKVDAIIAKATAELPADAGAAATAAAFAELDELTAMSAGSAVGLATAVNGDDADSDDAEFVDDDASSSGGVGGDGDSSESEEAASAEQPRGGSSRDGLAESQPSQGSQDAMEAEDEEGGPDIMGDAELDSLLLDSPEGGGGSLL